MPGLPAPIAELAAELARLPGAVAVVLGGSRAAGTERPDSDWDLGLYYRAERPVDPADVRRLGHAGYVSELGEWGPIVWGGAWLTVGGLPVDVLFRDLDRVEGWLEEARAGRFEVLPQSGHIVGAPTYQAAGELALCRPLSGDVPRPDYPEPLAASAPGRWLGGAAVALTFARIHAGLGDAVACTGMLSQAVLCTAHARLAAEREWVLNEKRLVARAGLEPVQEHFARPGDLAATVAAVGERLGVEPLAIR